MVDKKKRDEILAMHEIEVVCEDPLEIEGPGWSIATGPLAEMLIGYIVGR